MYLSATICDGVLAMVGRTMLCICVFSLHFYSGISLFPCICQYFCIYLSVFVVYLSATMFDSALVRMGSDK